MKSGDTGCIKCWPVKLKTRGDLIEEEDTIIERIRYIRLIINETQKGNHQEQGNQKL